MKNFQLSILAADFPFYTGGCESLIIPMADGKYGIMAHHINTMIAVIPGTLSYTLPGGDVEIVIVSYGLVRILDNNVLVLVDSAERPEDVEANRAKKADIAAKEADLHKSNIKDDQLAVARLARTIAKLKVKDDYDNI